MKRRLVIAAAAGVAVVSWYTPAFAAGGAGQPSENASCVAQERATRNSAGGDREKGAFGDVQKEQARQAGPYGQSMKEQKAGCDTAESPEVPTDPGTTDPGTTDPGTTDPGTTDPGTTDPGTTDPGTGSDVTPPVIVEAVAVDLPGSDAVDVTFSEPVQNVGTYTFYNADCTSASTLTTTARSGAGTTTIRITPRTAGGSDANFRETSIYSIGVTGELDAAGNPTGSESQCVPIDTSGTTSEG